MPRNSPSQPHGRYDGIDLGSQPREEATLSRITLDLPDDTLLALRVTEEEAGNELRMVAAAKLVELGRLSTGAAARLAGLPRVVFLARLADYGVDTFRLSEDELREEARLA